MVGKWVNAAGWRQKSDVHGPLGRREAAVCCEVLGRNTMVNDKAIASYVNQRNETILVDALFLFTQMLMGRVYLLTIILAQ